MPFTHAAIVFPRWREEIEPKLRTLLHYPEYEGEDWDIGDTLLLSPHPNFPRAMVATIEETSLAAIDLDTISDADLRRLCLPDDREIALATYRERWNTIAGSEPPVPPIEDHPVVWRLVFRYGY